jgi:hypothetical protein
MSSLTQRHLTAARKLLHCNGLNARERGFLKNLSALGRPLTLAQLQWLKAIWDRRKEELET